MKNKNPFLMIGSYIGLAAGLVLSYFSFAAIFALAELGMFKSIALLIPVVVVIICFFIGWGINILFLKILR